MTEAAHEYHSGDQDVSEQVATFSAFGKLMKWGSLTIAVLLLTLILWFVLNAGFFGGLVPGVLVAAVGVYFLRSKPQPAH
jgi:hypothetical protein